MNNFLSFITKASAAPVNTEIGPVNNLGDFVNTLIDKIIPILGGAAFLVIVFAGYIYMTSQGDQTKTTLAKDLIIGALTGILLLFLIGILRTQIGF